MLYLTFHLPFQFAMDEKAASNYVQPFGGKSCVLEKNIALEIICETLSFALEQKVLNS